MHIPVGDSTLNGNACYNVKHSYTITCRWKSTVVLPAASADVHFMEYFNLQQTNIMQIIINHAGLFQVDLQKRAHNPVDFTTTIDDKKMLQLLEYTVYD